MKSESVIGKINRFGCEFTVIKDEEKDSCYVQDCHGNEFKLSKKAGEANEDILENAKKLLKAVGM
jgi:hypothetical protein